MPNKFEEVRIPKTKNVAIVACWFANSQPSAEANPGKEVRIKTAHSI